VLARIPGVGDVGIYGAGDYAMRVWLDPHKVAARQLTAGEVIAAIREQNIQVSAGQLGAEPSAQKSDKLLSINVRGRLKTAEEFGDIVLKSGEGGQVVRLADVARIELGASDYTLRSWSDTKNMAAVGIFLSPGANALGVAEQVYAAMDRLSKDLPEGVAFESSGTPRSLCATRSRPCRAR
jgi:multidrug efflux pump